MKKLALTTVIISMICASTITTTAHAESALIISPSSIIEYEDGGFLVTDIHNKAVWQYENGEYTKISGKTNIISSTGVPVGGYNDSDDAFQAMYINPWSITEFDDGYAISDTDNNIIRYLHDGGVTTLAGNSKTGLENGIGNEVSFARPTGIATDNDGNLFVADTDNHVIRKISKDGNVSTYAGSSEGNSDGTLKKAEFTEPTGIYFYEDALYVADTGNSRICKIEDGKVTTIAGADDGTEGFADGTVQNALLSYPLGVYVDDDVVYIADTGNGAIRKVEDGIVSTIIEMGEGADGFYPLQPRDMLIDGNTLYVTDTFANVIFTLDLSDIEKEDIFDDVPDDAWYKDALYEMYRKGIINGTSENTFSPNATVTRGMFVTTLSRTEQYLAPYALIVGNTNFTDVNTSLYYANPISWAFENGITTGTSATTFSPENTLTRAECVTFLYRYASLSDVSLGDESKRINTFNDINSLPSWAHDAMTWAVQNEIITGKPNNMLAPNDSLTRAEMAQILSRFIALN